MLVSKLIEEKAILKYIPKSQLDDYDVSGIEKDTEYFLIINTKDIFKTTNNTKVYAVMRNNQFQGLSDYSGCCSWGCDFVLFNEGHSIC